MRRAVWRLGLVALLLAAPVAASNRLARESSPYLRLHAENPVDWYPWGPEALERARKEQKPLFVSIGYSTCFWCHVMAREVFSDPAIAKLMNEWFVNVKVDREERPDLDGVYMLATQLLTGGGGWPNSLFLTPDRKPFFAGTYFPATRQHGKPAFPEVLRNLHDAWTSKRAVVLEQAARLETEMRRLQQSSTVPAALARLPEGDVLARLTVELAGSYDSEWGGFGEAPKFPSPSQLHALLERQARGGDAEAANMLTGTLDHMVRGGIFDQVGGGFHRYATDRRWLVPHFEKMLHDSALLAPILARAGTQAGRVDFLAAARRTLDFVLREMTSPEGSFYSALDAQTAAGEGAFYLWSASDLEQILGRPDAEFLAPLLGFAGQAPFAGGRFVPHLPKPVEPRDAARVETLERKLLERRSERPRPAVDTKVLTDWNGLAIRAFALASRELKEPRYLVAARAAAAQLLAGAAKTGQTCKHVTNRGKCTVDAFLDDYAFLAGGLLALHEATGERRWLDETARLVAEADRRLWSADRRRYRFSEARPDVLLDAHETVDLAIPSGNSWMARCLVDLGRATRSRPSLERARELLASFAGPLEQSPSSIADMAVALARYRDASQTPDATAPVTLRAGEVPAPAASGTGFRVDLTLSVAAGWHVNSAKPLQEFLAPISLALDAGSPLVLEGVEFPDGKRVKLGFADEALSVYEGEVRVPVRLRVAPGARPGAAHARLRVRVQPCNDRVCEAPRELTCDLELIVGSAR
ncbi:MAG: DUF255 domain-containing protein [Candidatus Wallbacteria bacterium]|nr:DUF255 domain-containing protein [Candidatus Wallbacteria bacterium]